MGKKLRFHISVSSLIILFSLSAILIFTFIKFPILTREYQYSNIGKHPKTIADLNRDEAYSYADNQVIYEFIYSPTCSDCITLEDKIAPKLHNLSKEHVVLMLNIEKNNYFRTYAKQNSILEMPAIIIKQHDKVIEIYQGIDENMWSKVLK